MSLFVLGPVGRVGELLVAVELGGKFATEVEVMNLSFFVTDARMFVTP